MRNRIFVGSLFLILIFIFHPHLSAQKSEWVNQIITINGGKYEAPPYSDFSTIQTYDPVTNIVQIFDTIFTQSVSDVVIHENIAYVAAQDSIIMYNIDSYERIHAILDSGINKLYYSQNKLILTKKYPVSKYFVEILDATNLALIGFVQGLSGECSGALISKNLLYVAVDSGWSGTRGKLAVIDPSDNWRLIQEVDLGTDAKGINDLYDYNQKILSINKTPMGGLGRGSISSYDPQSGVFQTQVFDVWIGNSIGISGNLLYTKLNDGIGSINLDTWIIEDTSIITIPGPPGSIVIHSGTVDYVNNLLYLNIGNYTTFGVGIITTPGGDSTGSYPTGINPDGIAVDYRTPQQVPDSHFKTKGFTIAPNPVLDMVNINSVKNEWIRKVEIADLTGQTLFSRVLTENQTNLQVDCSGFVPGVYLISLIIGENLFSGKLVKR